MLHRACPPFPPTYTLPSTAVTQSQQLARSSVPYCDILESTHHAAPIHAVFISFQPCAEHTSESDRLRTGHARRTVHGLEGPASVALHSDQRPEQLAGDPVHGQRTASAPGLQSL